MSIPTPPTPAIPPIPPTPATPATIVVAASYPPLGRFIALALRLDGYEPHLLADGAGALAYLLSQPFAAAILDVELSRVDGFTVCQRVRAVSSAPIILVLPQDGRSHHVHARSVGASAVLSLPCGVEELLACVQALVPARNDATVKRVL
jgi:DNA-binding response OmpR family regulator